MDVKGWNGTRCPVSRGGASRRTNSGVATKRYGDGNALAETMHATHITLPITNCSLPDVGMSRAVTGVERALSGWMMGCTIGTHVTEVS